MKCRIDSPFAAVLYSASVDHPDHPDIRALISAFNVRKQCPEFYGYKE
jgi:hypothetical protein